MIPTSQFAHHPDLESLNAFLENALPAPERESVLAHLAACSHCRQIAYLAQSAVEEEPAPQPVEPVRNRFRQWLAGFKPGNRRLVILAGACATLAAFTIISLPKHTVTPAPQQEAKNAPAPNPSSSPASNAAQPQLKPAPPERTKDTTADATVAHSSAAAPRSRVGEAGPTFPRQATIQARHESLGAVVARKSNESAPEPEPQLSPSPAIGSATETVAVSAAPPLQPVPQPELHQTISAAQVETMNADVASKPIPAEAKSAPPRPATLGGQGFGKARGGIAAAYGNNHAIGAAQAARSATFYAPAPNANDDLLAGKAMQTLLPTGSHPTATVAARQRVLAIDPTGALYLSQNAGTLWLPITQQWTGRATSLRIFASPPADTKSPTTADKISPVAGNAPSSDAATPKPLFELTTDRGAHWLSEDGTTWKPRDKP
jgi:hypothetical protein